MRKGSNMTVVPAASKQPELSGRLARLADRSTCPSSKAADWYSKQPHFYLIFVFLGVFARIPPNKTTSVAMNVLPEINLIDIILCDFLEIFWKRCLTFTNRLVSL